MAFTATLVCAGNNRLRYLLVSSEAGESISIESDGGASPDLQTDSLAGPIKQISRVKTQGYGVIPAGGIVSAAQARALLQSDLAAGVPTPFGPLMSTLITRITQRTGGPGGFDVLAVRGPSDTGTPGLTLTNRSGGAASAYLDVELPGSIGC